MSLTANSAPVQLTEAEETPETEMLKKNQAWTQLNQYTLFSQDTERAIQLQQVLIITTVSPIPSPDPEVETPTPLSGPCAAEQELRRCNITDDLYFIRAAGKRGQGKQQHQHWLTSILASPTQEGKLPYSWEDMGVAAREGAPGADPASAAERNKK